MNPVRHALALDGLVNNPAQLKSADFLERIVRQAATMSGMRTINVTTSHVVHDLAKLGKEAFVDEGGVSVLALISTSHIALHAWDLRGRFMFDLVSCRPFDQLAVRRWLMEQLDVKELSHDSTVGSQLPLVVRRGGDARLEGSA